MSNQSKRFIQLVVPPMSNDYYGVSRSKDYPPLGLLSIATYLKNKTPSIHVEILDGEILSLKEIEDQIKGDVVGISVNILNYRNALRIARKAKEMGAMVVFGGAHASALSDLILQNRDYIDAVVVGDGEVAFCNIVDNKPFSEIENLVYRNQNEIKKNPVRFLNLDLLPFVNRKLVNQEIYFQNFRKQRSWSRFKRPDMIYSQKGCVWRMKTGGCLFCGRMDGKWRARSPEKVWEEITRLVTEQKVDYINDVSASITGNKEWVREFRNAKPATINPALEVYACAHEIDEEIIRIFSDLNVYKVFIGVESGDRLMLRRVGKPASPELHLKVLKALAKNGIKVTLGIVIGAPGENEETIAKTIKHAETLVEYGNVETISCSILVPVPGSKAYTMLLQHPKLKQKYEDDDDIDPIELERDWLRHFCKIDYPTAQKTVEEILSLVPLQSRMVMPKRNCSNQSLVFENFLAPQRLSLYGNPETYDHQTR